MRPTFGVTVGNVATFASAGLAARVGLGVPGGRDARTPPVRLCLTFAGEARAVGHDVFLDGNLLRRGGHRVAKEWLVADLSVGLVLAVQDRVTLAYAHTLRTREFASQTRTDQFGSVALVVQW